MNTDIKGLHQKNGYYVDSNGNQIIKICRNCEKKFPWKRDTSGKYCCTNHWRTSKEHKQQYHDQFAGKKLLKDQVAKAAEGKRGIKQTRKHIESRVSKRRGMHDTPETIERRRKALKGKKRSGSALKKIRDGTARQFGFSSYEESLQFPAQNYRTKEEVEQKKLALVRDNYQCLICGSKNYLEVDHIIDKRLMFVESQIHNLFNLITLCRKCHRKKRSNYLKYQTFYRETLSKLYGYNYTNNVDRDILFQIMYRDQKKYEDELTFPGQ